MSIPKSAIRPEKFQILSAPGIKPGHKYVMEDIKYDEDPKRGTVTYTINGVKKSISTYVNGRLNGRKTTYGDKGKLNIEANYVDGQQHGERVDYYTYGKMISHYDMGVQSGDQINYYEGDIAIRSVTPYVNDEKHGTKIKYSPDGSVESTITYDHGKKV